MDSHHKDTSFFDKRKPVADRRVLRMAKRIKADRKKAAAAKKKS